MQIKIGSVFFKERYNSISFSNQRVEMQREREWRDAERKGGGGERCRERGRGENERCIEKKGEGRLENEQSLTLGLGLEKASHLYVFFLSVGLVKPVRFGSIGFKL